MSPTEAVRLCAALAQCEMALVRRDAVAPALLAQAARHADGLGPGALVAAAAALARALDPGDDAPQRAGRKVVQALCRAAVLQAEEALLPAGPR